MALAMRSGTSNEEHFLMQPELQEFLHLASNVGTRKEIQSAFIHQAIAKDFVNEKTHMYEIHRVPVLYNKIMRKEIPPKDIFKYLREHYLSRVKTTNTTTAH